MLSQLVHAGLVSLSSKPHCTEIAGSLVRLTAVSPGAIAGKIVADPYAVSR